jgi:hypothetical protein
MKRILAGSVGAALLASTAVSAASGPAAAASPRVAAAIEAIEAVGNDPGKLRLFCRLFDLLQDSDDKDAEAEIKQKMSEIAAGIGPEFAAAWAVSEDIDENSPDGQEYYNAIDDVADKCQ